MNELQTILTETVTRLLADHVTPEVLQAAETGTWPDRLWHALEEYGLTLPLVPERQGGAGGTWRDACIVARAAGRHAAPVPLPETILAGWLLSDAGLDVPAGPITVAPVRPEDTLRLERRTSGVTLDGTATRVPWGARADHVVVVASVDGRPVVALADTAHRRAVEDKNLALEPRDTLTFENAPVVAAGPASARVPAHAVRLYGALLRSAQMAGALESVLEESARHVGVRVQFGRPLGKFQAIQHQLAVLATQTAAAGIAAENAFRAADRGDPTFEIAVAKARVGEAAGMATSIAHQVHGAIGFTYEHVLHFSTRRLWSWRTEFGNESYWAEALGRHAAARGADSLWPDLTAR